MLYSLRQRQQQERLQQQEQLLTPGSEQKELSKIYASLDAESVYHGQDDAGLVAITHTSGGPNVNFSSCPAGNYTGNWKTGGNIFSDFEGCPHVRRRGSILALPPSTHLPL